MTRCRQSTEGAGRPFIVGGELRTADPVGTGSWSRARDRHDAPACGPEVRQAVVEHYVRTGLMEHASVASFARFVLQLLAVGAPPELILDAQEAMQHEVRHARACFAIARRYGGHALGPGPLPIDGALDRGNDLATIARATIREGCIGQTLAAVEVEEAATWARDATIASTLAHMAEDELAHARLAWRFVAWALQHVSPPERDGLAHVFWDAINDARFAEPSRAYHELDPIQLRAHGVLPRADRIAVRLRALDSMIEPTAASLLASGATASPAATRLI